MDSPAFPIQSLIKQVVIQSEELDNGKFDKLISQVAGLTKREYFAGLALQGLLSAEDYGCYDTVARESVELADKLAFYLGGDV